MIAKGKNGRSVDRLSHGGRRNAPSAGFTLIELLVVLAIGGILLALLFPALGKMKIRSQQAESTSRLRTLGVAFASYASENGGRLPPSTSNTLPQPGVPQPGVPGGRWPIHLMPYLELPPTANYNKEKAFRCPTQDGIMAGASTSRGIFGYNKFFTQTSDYLNWSRLIQIDNPSQLPLLAAISGEGETPGSVGAGGLHLEVFGPHPSAKRYGYTGRTSQTGPAPTLDGTTLYLMADFHVEALRDWPWTTTGSSFHPKRDLQISPPPL